ncbi:DUF6790 family protein [Microbacterium sp. RD1]|uniref:DUF6790 family protein n=1 Tax=Microbacterium sp. RD1 TaxID=3457313 RepID=UPI003FA53D0F
MESIISGVLWVVIGDSLMTFAVIGLIIGLITSAVHRRRGVHDPWQTLLDWFTLWGLGISFVYNFIMHSVFGDFTAQTIGWAQSPFQLELAFASLGIGIVGVIAFPRRTGMLAKVLALIAPAVFLWGAAGGHIYQSIANDDFAFSNAGPILYTDILLPVVGIVLLVLASQERRRAVEPEVR